METLSTVMLAACVGIGLSAACGFRIFVPMLGLSIAANSGQLQLASGFDWIGSPVALVAFAVATIIEVGAYYVPWVDNLLDSIATPAAVVAGTIATGSMTGEMSPFLQWGLALVAGGGTAGVVQAGSVLVRGTSSATTGGLGNPIVSTGELAGSATITFLAIFIPALAAFLTAALLIWIISKICKKVFGKKDEELAPPPVEPQT
ncbi:MAG: DUF4126 domain-containing protein [Lentisphaerales bacterium]|nr:DUF4126 domain-containing protein [Lentisphaerales bacterium]